MPSVLPRGLVCHDQPDSRRALESILESCGFDVVATVDTLAQALVAAELSTPDVMVVDLALTGDLGLGMVPVFRAARPGCAVVVVSSFEGLRSPALAAGAYDFVVESDLRDLERSLRRLAGELARQVVVSTGAVARRRRAKAPPS